ncbi:MAG: carboxynorspermidine decarboxylase, partial [Pseudomonadota bacterium]|nr:carboxynorspermidine decarboxylase [Pseudomonadota bacterium]
AILDISATCHMPDVLEAPYRPALISETPGDGVNVVLGGPSCLAGDVIGTYTLPERPVSGQRLAFLDQAHYSMVKTTTFNGMKMPSIAIWNSQTDALRLVREFNYSDFERRLS